MEMRTNISSCVKNHKSKNQQMGHFHPKPTSFACILKQDCVTCSLYCWSVSHICFKYELRIPEKLTWLSLYVLHLHLIGWWWPPSLSVISTPWTSQNESRWHRACLPRLLLKTTPRSSIVPEIWESSDEEGGSEPEEKEEPPPATTPTTVEGESLYDYLKSAVVTVKNSPRMVAEAEGGISDEIQGVEDAEYEKEVVPEAWESTSQKNIFIKTNQVRFIAYSSPKICSPLWRFGASLPHGEDWFQVDELTGHFHIKLQ